MSKMDRLDKICVGLTALNVAINAEAIISTHDFWRYFSPGLAWGVATGAWWLVGKWKQRYRELLKDYEEANTQWESLIQQSIGGADLIVRSLMQHNKTLVEQLLRKAKEDDKPWLH